MAKTKNSPDSSYEPVSNPTYLSEKDYKKVLELALKKQMQNEDQTKDKINLRYIQEAAADMGITHEEINQALTVHTKNKTRLRIFSIIGASIVSLAILIGGITWWQKRPQVFTKNARVVLAHKLDAKKKPIKEAKQFGLNQSFVYLHITWLDLPKKDYHLSYRWTGPKGN